MNNLLQFALPTLAALLLAGFLKIAADLAFASHSMRQTFQTKVPTKSNQSPTNP